MSNTGKVALPYPAVSTAYIPIAKCVFGSKINY